MRGVGQLLLGGMRPRVGMPVVQLRLQVVSSCHRFSVGVVELPCDAATASSCGDVFNAAEAGKSRNCPLARRGAHPRRSGDIGHHRFSQMGYLLFLSGSPSTKRSNASKQACFVGYSWSAHRSSCGQTLSQAGEVWAARKQSSGQGPGGKTEFTTINSHIICSLGSAAHQHQHYFFKLACHFVIASSPDVKLLTARRALRSCKNPSQKC